MIRSRVRDERINRAPPMPRGEAREDRPVRNGALAIDLGELGRLQPVREWSPADPAAGTPSRRSRDRAVPGPSARLLAGQRHAGAPVRDRGPVPRRDPEPRPRDDRFVGGNLLAMWHLVEPADEIVVILPNYMENWGLVQAFGGNVTPLRLREDRKWQFDPDELSSLVTRKTKAIAICDPNNPTGAVMGDAQRKSLLD